MREHCELIEISADGFQLGEHRFQLVHLIDCSPKCRAEKVFTLGQSRFCDDLFDLPPFSFACPEGYFLIPFAAGFGCNCIFVFYCLVPHFVIFSGVWGCCPDHGIGTARRIFRRVPKPSACLAKGKPLPPLMRGLFRENHRNHLRLNIFVRVG